MSNATMTNATISNATTKTETNKGTKYYFDLISLTALKVETVVLLGVLLTCVYKVITSFLL